MTVVSRFLRTVFVALAFACALFSQGCGSFPGNPPLPKQASIEHGARPTAETDYSAVVENADVIYFPSDRAAFGSRAEPAALLLDAMQRAGTPFAIAWDIVDVSQQPLLEQIAAAPTSAARDEVIARLEIGGSGRAREHCRSVLRDPRFATVRQIPLRWTAAMAAMLESGQRLSAVEERELPHGFTSPESASGRTRAVMQQFAAEQIVRHFNTSAAPGKLLVFLQHADLAAGQGVPFYVAQKLSVRQLVLDSQDASRRQPSLLTRLSAQGEGASPKS
ncbi:MAG: hypothetical protein ACR2ID_05190 [Chthoniobacterales bacterium]